jgi:hypothetical protein
LARVFSRISTDGHGWCQPCGVPVADARAYKSVKTNQDKSKIF